jgi:uncharacterized coiled-coil protein SlyX
MSTTDKKINSLEERIRNSENALATINANITNNTNHIKENMSRMETDVSHRIDTLTADMKDNNRTITNSVNALNDSLQKLYVSHSGAQNTVKFNEKIVWGIVGIIVTGGLYIIQDFIRVSGGG